MKPGLQTFDQKIAAIAEHNQVPALSCAVQHKGEIIYSKAFGKYGGFNSNPVEPETSLFRIASIAKSITGLALGRMIDKKMLSLDESIFEYLPQYPKNNFDISIKHLATHTSGIRSYKGKELFSNKSYGIEEGLALFKNDPLLFVPGADYYYSSYNYVLLSAVMQIAAKESFGSFVQREVLDALKMSQTFEEAAKTSLSKEMKKRTVKMYSKTKNGFKRASRVNNGYKIAAGGYLSTATDIIKLGQAALDQSILESSTWDEVLTQQFVMAKPTYYGLGWQCNQELDDMGYIGHIGQGVGAYTNLFVYPDAELVVALLINASVPNLQTALDSAYEVLRKEIPQ